MFVYILSKSRNDYAGLLHDSIHNSHIIYDGDYSDDECLNAGFHGLTCSIKTPSAWDKSFYHLSQNTWLLDQHSHFWFIEDDVYTKNISVLISFLDRLASYNHDFMSHDIAHFEDTKDWYFWKLFPPNIMAYNSFNPICRLSKDLINNILLYQKVNNKFIFHEVLFPSLMKLDNMSYIDMRYLDFWNEYFGIFHYRPIIRYELLLDDKIYHPVKPKYI